MTNAMPVPLDVRLMNWVANTLFLVFVALGLGGLALWAARHPAWALGGITVHGDVAHQNEVTFRAHLLPRLQGSFLTLDLQEVKRLFEGVPWVRQAVVQREFPNRLKVTLEEHRPVAWWGEAGSGRLINAQGEVFEASPDEPGADGWVELRGPEGYAAQVHALYEGLGPVLRRLELGIRRLGMDSRGSWKAELDNGAVMVLGRGDADMLMRRVHTWVGTMPQLTQRYGRDLESVDLRYPNGYAVRLRGVTTVPVNEPDQASTKR